MVEAPGPGALEAPVRRLEVLARKLDAISVGAPGALVDRRDSLAQSAPVVSPSLPERLPVGLLLREGLSGRDMVQGEHVRLRVSALEISVARLARALGGL